jgi:hypothetical protein
VSCPTPSSRLVPRSAIQGLVAEPRAGTLFGYVPGSSPGIRAGCFSTRRMARVSGMRSTPLGNSSCVVGRLGSLAFARAINEMGHKQRCQDHQDRNDNQEVNDCKNIFFLPHKCSLKRSIGIQQFAFQFPWVTRLDPRVLTRWIYTGYCLDFRQPGSASAKEANIDKLCQSINDTPRPSVRRAERRWR